MNKVKVGYKNLLDDKVEFTEIEANSLITAAYKYAKQESEEIYDAIINKKVALALNGNLIEVDRWKTTKVQDNDSIEIISKLSGGKGKFLGVLMIALGIAAIVFAPSIAPIELGALGSISQAQLTLMGVSWILSGMTRLIFTPDLPNSTGGTRETQTYSWSGIKTTARSDLPIPIMYGTCMTGGNVISAFTDIKNNDNYLNLLISLGEGEIDGICKEDNHSSSCTTSDVSNASYENPAIYINEQPLRNYTNVQWWYRLGTNTQSKVPNFDGAKQQFPDGREITTDWLEYTTTKEVDAIDAHLSIPVLFDASAQNGATNPSNITIQVQFKEESEGSYHTHNFVRWQPSYQNSGNGWMVGEKYLGTPYRYDEKPPTYYLRCIDHTTQTDVLETVRGNITNTWTKTATIEIKDQNGNIEYEDITFAYDGAGAQLTKVYPYLVDLSSSFRTWDTLTVTSTSSTTSNYYIEGVTKTGIIETLHLDFNTIVDGSGKGKYTIRFRRTSAASTEFDTNNNISLKNVIEIIDGDFTYPNTALLGVRIKATNQLSGGLPNLKVLLRGKKVQVPDTSGSEDFTDLFYNSTLDRFETSAGSERTWDGSTYVDEYSHNSMLCVRDLVLSDRYGIGKYLSTSDLYNTGIINALKSCHKKWFPSVINYLSWYTSSTNWDSYWEFIAGSGTSDSSVRTISPSGSPSYSIEFKGSTYISKDIEHTFKITLSSLTGYNVDINLYGVIGSDYSRNILLGSVTDKGSGQHSITFTPTVSRINSFLVVIDSVRLVSGDTANIGFTITDIELKNSSTSAEHYHTMNGAIDSKQSATTAIFEACDSFRCWPIWFKGTYNFVLNEDIVPTHNITSGNIREFKESFTPLSEIPHQLIGEYLDKDLNYEMKSIIAKTTDSSIPEAREQNIGMKWLTDRKRVERELKFKLNAVTNTKLSVNFKCGLDSIHATAGDIINVQHPLPEWGSGGRLLSYNQASTFAVLDSPFTFDDVTATHLLKYQTDENSYVTATVDTTGFVNGDSSDKITTISWPSSNPTDDAVYLIGKTSNIKPFRLTKVARNSNNEVDIEAIEHLSSLYSEQDIVVIRDNYSQLPIHTPATKPNPPVALYITNTSIETGIGFEFTLDLGNQTVQDTVIQMSTDQTFGYQTLLIVDSSQRTAKYVNNNLIIGQTYYFKAFCRNGSVTSDPLFTSYSLIATNYIPPAPSGIHLKGLNPNSIYFDDKDIVLQWNPVGAVYSSPGPLSGYIVEVYHTSISSSNLLRTAFVKSEEFTYTLGNNLADSSSSTPHNLLIFVLYSQTANNITSSASIPFKVTNPEPATVSNLTAAPFMGGVKFAWDDSTEQDHKNYKCSVKVESESYRSWQTIANNSYTYSVTATDADTYSNIIDVKLRVKDVDTFDQESNLAASLQSGTLSVVADNVASVGDVSASDVSGWAYPGDPSTIDGNVVQANTVNANKINVSQLSAISANMGELTSGTVTGAQIRTASSGKRVTLNSAGIHLETGATGATYGDSTYKYGDSTRKYGTGVFAYIMHDAKDIPFYIQEEQIVADFHYYPRSSNPTGAAEIGDTAVVNGKLSQCTSAGTPGTWEPVDSGTGSETDPIVGAINGIVKADGAGNISAAVAGTDYGDVVGPSSSTTENIALFDGSTGKLIKDSGKLITISMADDSNISTNHAIITYGNANWGGSGTGDVVGPSSAVSGGITLFDGTTGKLIKDSSVLITTSTADDGNISTNHAMIAYGNANWGGGYTNLTSFVDQTAWRLFYSNTDGDVTELALGTSGQYLKSNGAAAAPSWDTPSGGSSLWTDAGAYIYSTNEGGQVRVYDNGQLVSQNPAGVSVPLIASNKWGYSSSFTETGDQLLISGTGDHTTSPAVWIEKDYISNGTPTGDPTVPVALYVAHEHTGTGTAFTHSIMAYALNNGTGDNDCVAVSGRVRKLGAGVGDSAGIWGSAYNEVNQNGGVMALEGAIYQNVAGMVASDNLGSKWSTGLHITSISTGSPALAGIGIDGSGTYRMWNAILIDKESMAGAGATGTVGINMSNFDTSNYPQYALKFGYGGSDTDETRGHIYCTSNFKVVSRYEQFYFIDTDNNGSDHFKWYAGTTPNLLMQLDTNANLSLYGNAYLSNGKKLKMGTYQDFTVGELTSTVTPYPTYSEISTSNTLYIDDNSGNEMVTCIPGGSVILFWNNNERLRTDSTGITVHTGCSGCDYVFENDYDLMPLNELNEFITAHKQLPLMTVHHGYDVNFSELRREVIEKIEEQTLYILQLHDRIKNLERRQGDTT